MWKLLTFVVGVGSLLPAGHGFSAADVILVPDDALRQLAASGKIAGDSMTAVASSRVGVAVRAGAPRPDIATAEALRGTRHAEAGKKLIAFLETRQAREVMNRKGMQAGGL